MKHQNSIRYGRLCLTTGAVPRIINSNNPFVMALRDTESLEKFEDHLKG